MPSERGPRRCTPCTVSASVAGVLCACLQGEDQEGVHHVQSQASAGGEAEPAGPRGAVCHSGELLVCAPVQVRHALCLHFTLCVCVCMHAVCVCVCACMLCVCVCVCVHAVCVCGHAQAHLCEYTLIPIRTKQYRAWSWV